jgi:hypothetical protein
MGAAEIDGGSVYPALARPAMHRQLGISWRVTQKMFVPRRRLSDRLLGLLKCHR